MVIAIHLPDNIAEQFKADRLQSSLHKLRLLSEKYNRTGGLVAGKCVSTMDVGLMRQLEASFCCAREVDKKGEILIDPNDPTHGGKVCAAASSGQR